MAFTPSIAIFFLILVAGSIEAGSKQRREQTPVVHEGKCPSHNFPIQIHCRRRVCLPQEMIPLCKVDGDCPTTHKCCRPMCSCRDRCVEAIPQ